MKTFVIDHDSFSQTNSEKKSKLFRKRKTIEEDCENLKRDIFKKIASGDLKFNSKVDYTRYIRKYLNLLGFVELPKIQDEDMPFFKEIAATTNPNDLDEGSEIKIIRRKELIPLLLVIQMGKLNIFIGE